MRFACANEHHPHPALRVDVLQTALAQLDAFYKKEIAAGAAMAKSINLQAQ